ncbi:UDP-N-acetylmuramate--L-alanine ligase [Kyrpidia spormannii]|nr:UDP-N-acetylmuramate--L-alanine ligase [Kyrpidia spormannii]
MEQLGKHVHFVGIGGYGMSALARVLLDWHISVSGSDVAANALTDELARRGAVIAIGHRASQVDGADCVVYSSAVSPENPELVEARRRGLRILHRSELLAEILQAKKGIAVAGAHGKTTTSSMIAFVMNQAGLDPTYIVGGVISNLGENAKAGLGPYAVAEADESDGTFLNYHPYVAVVTNIEPDHLENYGGKFENLRGAYKRFLGQVREGGLAVLCADDPELSNLGSQLAGRTVWYGFSSGADWTAEDVDLHDGHSRCRVFYRKKYVGDLTLSVPGRHNISDALAAIAVCREAGIPFSTIAEILSSFRGAKRRFQQIADVAGILIVDDYAHHPTEIEATLAAARTTGRRIVAVFQPQRYTRTHFLLDQFSYAFKDADEVIITDIYSPIGEQKIAGVSAERLAQLIRERSNERVRFLRQKQDVINDLLSRVHPGDLVLFMGAGDIWMAARQLAEALQDGLAEPMARA